MPFLSPLRPCASPGCTTRVPNGRCEKHRRYATQRQDNWTALYGTNWPRIRFDYLSRHPVCVLCGHLATIADHYPLGIRKLLRNHHPDPHADDNLRPLCQPCHAKETGIREPGGWAVGRQ